MSGCETNPPNSWEETKNLGNVYISSNIDEAEIFVNDKTSGQFTPDTLYLEEGTYDISLKKDGYFSVYAKKI